MTKAIKKDTIHAGGIDIGIYTTDFKNEYISLTDIAKYRSIQPSITIMLNVVLFGKLHDLAARQLNVLDSVNLEDLPQLPDIKKE